MKKFITCFFLLLSINLSAKIYDCFPFFNELDILEVRLEELYDSVDHFVLVEGTVSFSGKPKPLYFQENIQRFQKYMDKIIHVIVDDSPELTGNPEKDNWKIMTFQRNCITRGLIDCADTDIVFISDVDEIIRPEAISAVKNLFSQNNAVYIEKLKNNPAYQEQFVYALDMRLFLYQLNREDENGWNGAVKAAPYWIVKQRLPNPLRLLHATNLNLPKIPNGGFHFHSMGGPDAVFYKMDLITTEYMHRDLLAQLRADQVEKMKHYWKKAVAVPVVSIDDTFPKFIREHADYFRSKGWIASHQYDYFGCEEFAAD